MAAKRDFEIVKGKTFAEPLRWEAEPVNYKAITAITQTAPVQITAPAHGLVSGWRAAVVSVKGMTQLNAESVPPKEKDYQIVTVIDADTIEFNKINAADFKAYVSGGYLQYNTPVNLAGYTARLVIKDKIGGVVLLTLTTENGGISIDNATKVITLNIAASDTATFEWKKGVFELEMVSGVVVTSLLTGNVKVSPEVAT